MASLGRWVFLRLSHSERAARWASRWGGGLARRFVAGDTLEEAVEETRRLNEQGFAVTLDHLGESVRDAAAAQAAAAEYVQAVRALVEAGLRATVSLKLTQMGLDIDRGLCAENVRRILEAARPAGLLVRIDMESSAYTDVTLELYRSFRAEGFDNVGIVLQAYLRRSIDDLRSLAPLRPNVRIVKGAYDEPPHLAYQGREAIREAYRRLLDEAWSACSRVAIATHDDLLIDYAAEAARRRQVPDDRYEFQMLYGVRPELAQSVLRRGYEVRIYLPYGRDWYAYFMRRLAERPSDAWRFGRLLLSGRAR
ncbi:MAG: proline dehydrogenase family protein [Firmicutes bacterium]|nr:proline dehydrogenase family protein [Bacillota bacterium]